MMHCAVKENEVTHDTYYIMKHIIRGIVKAVPEIRNFLLLQKNSTFNEFLSYPASLR